MHVAEIADRAFVNSHKYKDFTMPSGKIVQLQGGEPTAMQMLLDLYYEDNIITEKTAVPKIMYIAEDAVIRRYYPDFYIQSENKIIEVKCDYTYRSDLVRNIFKAAGCMSKGYLFEFWFIENNKFSHRVEVTPEWLDNELLNR